MKNATIGLSGAVAALAFAACSASSSVGPPAIQPVQMLRPTPAVAYGALVYSGPKCQAGTKGCPTARPEIDLYSTAPGSGGYSRSFKVTQAHWAKPFAYRFAAVPGHADDCPHGSRSAYVITPASGKPGKTFVVKAAPKAKYGECTMTIRGGGSARLNVRLTFTTSGVGIH